MKFDRKRYYQKPGGQALFCQEMGIMEHPEKDWSEQQKILIDSQIRNSRKIKLTREQYLKMIGELY